MMVRIQTLYDRFIQSSGVSIDSRTLKSGELFFAIRGDRFDGNDYVQAALDAGASHCIVDRPSLSKHPYCSFVPNTLTALQRLARRYRDSFDIPILAITGSNGKTTTKELVAGVLSQQCETHWTKGNFNNHLGVPLTLLSMPRKTEIAVIEMGANQVGEIDWLCHLANPTHGLITNIGTAHLEGFGSAGNVARAKFELYQYLDRTQGTCLVNGAEASLGRPEIARLRQVFRFSRDGSADHSASGWQVQFGVPDPFVQLMLTVDDDHWKIRTQLFGSHNENNVLCAIAVGILFHVGGDCIREGLETYQPANNRSQLMEIGGAKVYLDAYNANPQSVLAALNFFDSITSSRKVLVLGDMLELGHRSEELHQEVLERVAQMEGLESVILVGSAYTALVPSYPQINGVLVFDDSTSAGRYLGNLELAGCQLLLKGSRGLQLERILDELTRAC